MSTVGVIGASGTVGAGVTRALARAGICLRLGTRVPRRVHGLADEASRRGAPVVETQAVDLDDQGSLMLFLDGLDAVVSCAAPTSRWSHRTARSALAVGVPLIDPAGGDLLYGLGKHDDLHGCRSAVVVDAGMQPGLTGVMLRALLVRAPSVPSSVGLWHGGLGSLSDGSARDLLLTGTSSVRPHARRRAHRVVPFSDGTRQMPPGVPPKARVTPVLSDEINRICSAHGVPDAVEYQVIEGEHVAEVASYYAASPVLPGDKDRLNEAVHRLQDAALVDCTCRSPSYTLHAWAGNDELVVSTNTPFVLTAEVTALATLAIVEGRVDADLQPLDEIVNPAWVLSRLGALPGVTITGIGRHETTEDLADETGSDMEVGEIL